MVNDHCRLAANVNLPVYCKEGKMSLGFIPQAAYLFCATSNFPSKYIHVHSTGCAFGNWSKRIYSCRWLTSCILKKWVGTCTQQQICQICMVAQNCFVQRCAAPILAYMVHLCASLQQLEDNQKHVNNCYTLIMGACLDAAIETCETLHTQTILYLFCCSCVPLG